MGSGRGDCEKQSLQAKLRDILQGGVRQAPNRLDLRRKIYEESGGKSLTSEFSNKRSFAFRMNHLEALTK